MWRLLAGLALCLVAFFMMGHTPPWPGDEPKTVNFFHQTLLDSTAITADNCAVSKWILNNPDDAPCDTDYKSFRMVPTGHQLIIRGLAGYSFVGVPLAGAGTEECDLVLEAGVGTDYATTVQSMTLEVGPNSSPALTAAGDIGITEGTMVLDENDWYRLRLVSRGGCTVLQRGAVSIVGTMSRKM
jgi:hypothetical protein